ncbi:GTPase [Actinotalea sp. K2]|uniref:GTPase n=1 Tax=Actinotalea sp. K2 TaxID=2939438 RepID=UPI0020172C56|nr:GTPase [Actinotalea sp. K2]MCL3860351.1 50S ribosome-binding GTPase [Actinotalea sp. K2]
MPAHPTTTRPRAGVGMVTPRSGASARPMASSSLLDAVTDLRRDVGRTRFPLPLGGSVEAETLRRRLLDQLDDHLLPRLREMSAPAVVVMAGSTGAGKSTLVNSLLGTVVSPSGVLRPTTRRPVLAHHPDDAALLETHPLLEIVDVVEHASVPRGLALVDAPDLDSLVDSNRSTAHRLLEAADLWIFVTTAARYGDALPWQVLTQATERGTSMAMVLNRVPHDAVATVRNDLMGRLRERGMSTVPLFLVPDAGPHEGMLEAPAVAPILRWLTMVAGPDRARSVIARTQRGSLTALRPWVDELAEAVQDQADARTSLQDVVESAVAGPAERVVAAAARGAVADGPVRAAWAEISSAGGPLAGAASGALATRWGSARHRSTRVVALEALARELVSSARVVLDAARRQGELAVAEHLARTDAPGAEGVLEAIGARGEAQHPGVGEGDAGVPDPEEVLVTPTAERSAADWVLSATQTLRAAQQGADRRQSQRVTRLVRAVGENGAATLVLGAAAGLGAARAALESVLGSAQTHELVGRASDDLLQRVREQVHAGGGPARTVLADEALAEDASSRLRLRLAVLKGLV